MQAHSERWIVQRKDHKWSAEALVSLRKPIENSWEVDAAQSIVLEVRNADHP